MVKRVTRDDYPSELRARIRAYQEELARDYMLVDATIGIVLGSLFFVAVLALLFGYG